MSEPITAPSVKVPWVRNPNFLTCQHGHLLKFNDMREGNAKGWRGDLRRLSGHAFFECKTCRPPTFFFAVFVTEPDPHVMCYALDEGAYREWDSDPSSVTLSTPEMLYQLRDPDGRSYNPNWRAPR